MLMLTYSILSAEEKLWLFEKNDSKNFTVSKNGETVVFTRNMTSCAKNKGWFQDLIPFKGITPITEKDILLNLHKEDVLLVDMRMQSQFLEKTIPFAINIPFTEVHYRLNEFGCQKEENKWNCSEAKSIYAFCNGPVCPQSPIAINEMIKLGYPLNKIFYYRGGMLVWEALGLNTIEGDF